MEKVRLLGDPILTTVCQRVNLDDYKPEELAEFLNTMAETMAEEKGMGLAANQIGKSLRIFILKNADGTTREYINPVVIDATEPVEYLDGEGCLSIPGISAVTTRYDKVVLSWIDRHGIRHEDKFHGLAAVAVQHEMDHLNGKLYIDQFGPIKRKLLVKRHKKAIKGR